jgi:hypothetical protein
MQKTRDFLDAIRARYALTSDYQAAKKIGTTPQAVNNWRKGRDFLGETMAPRVAELLELEPGYVFACAQMERVRTDAGRVMWTSILAKFPRPATEEKRTPDDPEHCILCQIPTSYRRQKRPGALPIANPAFLAISRALAPLRALHA